MRKLSLAVVFGLAVGCWPTQSWAALAEELPAPSSAPLPILDVDAAAFAAMQAPLARLLADEPAAAPPEVSQVLAQALRSPEAAARAIATLRAAPDGKGVRAAAILEELDRRLVASPARRQEILEGLGAVFDGGGRSEDLPESVRRIKNFYRLKPALAKAEAKPVAPAETKDKIEVRFRVPIKPWLNPQNAAWYLLTSSGHHWSLKSFLRKTLNRLYIDGDSKNYTAHVVPNPQPNAMIDPRKAELWLMTGILPLTANSDQLAGILAHEMTHQNKEHLKAATDDPEIARMLDGLEGFKDLPPAQREEIRADLGAADRLIRAGYNPWAYYDVMKNMTRMRSRLVQMKVVKFLFKILMRSSFDYWEAHPAGEIRMKAIKGYLLYRRFEQDLSPVEGKFEPLPPGVRLMRWRAIPISFMLLSPVMWIVQLAPTIVDLLARLLGHFSARAAALVSGGWGATTGLLGKGWGIAGDLTHPVKSFIAGRLLDPLWAHTLGWPWSHGVVPAMAWLARVTESFGGPILPLVMVAAPVGFAFMNWRWLRKDELYPELRAVRRYARVMRRLSRRRDDSLRLRLTIQTVVHLQKVQKLYSDEDGSFIAGLRWFDGLSLARRRWTSLYIDLLEDLTSRLEQASMSERRALLAPYEAALAKTPPFIVENEDARAALEKVFAAVVPEGSLPGSLRLMRRVETAQSAPDVLALARALAEKGLLDTARRLMNKNRSQVRRFLFSPEDKTPQAAEDFIAAWKLLREKRTDADVGFWAGLRMDLGLLRWQAAALWSPLPRAIGLTAFARRLPSRGLFSVPLRWGLGIAERLSLRARLALRFDSVSGLLAFLRVEAAPASLDALSGDFYGAIAAHPAWLASQADEQSLLDGDFFWPKFGGTSPGFLESMMVEAVADFAKKYPDQWRYEPGASEKLQKLYLDALGRRGALPQDAAGREALWKTLSDRGVTSLTDEMFASLYGDASDADKPRLEDLALAGRLWDQPLKAKIVERRMAEWPDYRALLTETDPAARRAHLEKALETLKREYPERGLYFDAALEKLSRDIRSSMDESALISEAGLPQGGERAEDFGLRVLSHMTDSALGWSRRQQWALILFLRGDRPPTRKIRRAFRVIGPERVRRMYQIMPPLARTELLDQFIDSPRGLAGKLSLSGGYGRKIIDHVLPDKDLEARRTAYEILDAFLYSLKKTTGSSGMSSYVLAYMLAMPQDEAGSFGRTLKGVLELFGATGVKIGQLLAASELLPEEEAKHLRQLQERAREPRREQMYEDLRRITGRRDLPFAVEDLLGSASVKYGFSAVENETRERTFIKIFRASAIANTPTEFKILDTMSGRLYDKHGAKYGVFRSLVKASRRAVERELSAAHEVERSGIARRRVYAGASDADWAVEVPRETEVFPRMIASEFAPGMSVNDERMLPEERAAAAAKILSTEGQVYLGEKASPDEAFDFDPDRHPGNNRVAPRRLSPIDHGQGESMTARRREQIFDLFALAQVLKETGPTRWSQAELSRIMGDEADSPKLRRALGKYFPKPDLAYVAAYYSLLAALDESSGDLDIGYFDYVRGIVQLGQYDPMLAPGFGETPRQAFERIVRAKGEAYRRALTLTLGEKIRIGGWRFIWRATSRLRLDEAWRRLWLFSTRPATHAAVLFLIVAASGARVVSVPPIHAWLAAEKTQLTRQAELNFGCSQADYEYRLSRKIAGKDADGQAMYLRAVLEQKWGGLDEEGRAADALLRPLARRSDSALEFYADRLVTKADMDLGSVNEQDEARLLQLAAPQDWGDHDAIPLGYVRRLQYVAVNGKTPALRRAAAARLFDWTEAGQLADEEYFVVMRAQAKDADPETSRDAARARAEAAEKLSHDMSFVARGYYDVAAGRHLWRLYLDGGLTASQLAEAYRPIFENLDIKALGSVMWDLRNQLAGATWQDGFYHEGTGSGASPADLAAAREAAQAFLPEFVKMVSDKDRYDEGMMAVEGCVENGYLSQQQAVDLLYNASRGLASGDRGLVDSTIRRIKSLGPDKIGKGDQMFLPLGSR